jgi:uncharacterized membrane protein
MPNVESAMPIAPRIPRPWVDRRVTARLLMATELEKLPPDEREIVERFINRKHMARNVLEEFDESLSFGERLADHVAEIGGSWGFIIVFLLAMMAWMALNSFVLHREAFDPYPYILLNLALSCLAALQAPVIMMSQNRQADSDRAQAKNDYEVNVRAELEILQVHEKINAMRETELAELIEVARRQEVAIQALGEQLAARGD